MNQSVQISIKGPAAMQDIARDFVGNLIPTKNMATVVTLSGDLGAGKTTFAQGIAVALGVEETVTSPTFVIEKVYELTKPLDGARGKWTHLIHIDAYRLKSGHELKVLGWHEMVQTADNLIVIEWPEMVAELIPEGAIRVTLKGDGDVREISYGKENN